MSRGRGDAGAGVAFLGNNITSTMADCSVRDAYNHGILLAGNSSTNVTGTVIFNALGSNVKVTSRGNALRRNLAAGAVLRVVFPVYGTRTAVRAGMVYFDSYVANFDIEAGANLLRDNVAAGSHGMGYKFMGAAPSECHSQHGFHGNEAHTNLLGFAVGSKPEFSQTAMMSSKEPATPTSGAAAACSDIFNVKIWRSWNVAIWGAAGITTIKMEGVVIADSTDGVRWGSEGEEVEISIS